MNIGPAGRLIIRKGDNDNIYTPFISFATTRYNMYVYVYEWKMVTIYRCFELETDRYTEKKKYIYRKRERDI